MDRKGPSKSIQVGSDSKSFIRRKILEGGIFRQQTTKETSYIPKENIRSVQQFQKSQRIQTDLQEKALQNKKSSLLDLVKAAKKKDWYSIQVLEYLERAQACPTDEEVDASEEDYSDADMTEQEVFTDEQESDEDLEELE